MAQATPWPYFFVRLLFKFVLKIFYGTIVIENSDVIPSDGTPCIICANHSNSLTDAVLLVGAIPSKTRSFVRLTAKATQFGRGTFTSWLIEAAGTVPLKRRKDSPGVDIDNTEVLEDLKKAIEQGSAVCLFPEGASRFHPTLLPLKTGVARLISDVLTRNKDDPNFRVYLQTCSITYMHRQHFRSDVLITFHPPTPFTPKSNPELVEPVDFAQIRATTTKMQKQLASGTYDAPSWSLIRVAKLAARTYAPLGTRMSLGDYVRAVRAFVEAFKWAEGSGSVADFSTTSGEDGEVGEDEKQLKKRKAVVNALQRDLKEYQDELAQLGIKDERVRHPLSRGAIIYRLIVRGIMLTLLLPLTLPGLLLWAPIFISAHRAARRTARSGPVWDTYDELAQAKLVAGLWAGVAVWVAAVALTLPIAPLTIPLVPAFMWMTLRWLEDAVATGRALASLLRLLNLGPSRLSQLRTRRDALHTRVKTLAVEGLGLPADPETFFTQIGGREKGRVRSIWDGKIKYFSVKRRRKRDWNEILRLYDVVDYPDDAF